MTRLRCALAALLTVALHLPVAAETALSKADLRVQASLHDAAGLAEVGLGQSADGWRELAAALDAWVRIGDIPAAAKSLHDFGEAFAAAGEMDAALKLYHQEREITGLLMTAHAEAALKELRIRNDAQARQRAIELAARGNALKAEQLANDSLRQRTWGLVAAVLAISALIVARLLREVRKTQRQLRASHAALRQHTDQDALTQLANRRFFHTTMKRDQEASRFLGGLLLVDIDHFKRVNDTHGHAVGDQVIVEMSRRLGAAVRSADLVVRWGGEEFLVYAPGATCDQMQGMAARLLKQICSSPIETSAGPLHITASMGHASFPLPTNQAALPWEVAVKLVDLALYRAKRQGRDQAVGIASTTARDTTALQHIGDDFDNAANDGRVTLLSEPREA